MTIELKDICKSFMMGEEEIKALDHIDFSVEKGEFVSIIGPSGSRKINFNEYFRIIRCSRQRNL